MDASEAAAVLARARQGDSEAFRVLVEQHSRSVFRLAFRMIGNEQDAEDVVQESFLRAYRQLGRFESRANFGTWLYRITANCAVDLMRSKQARHDQSRAETLDDAVDTTQSQLPDPERMAGSAEIRDEGPRRPEPARTRRLHPASLRGPIDRGDQPHARPRHERGETQRVSCGEEAQSRTRAIGTTS